MTALPAIACYLEDPKCKGFVVLEIISKDDKIKLVKQKYQIEWVVKSKKNPSIFENTVKKLVRWKTLCMGSVFNKMKNLKIFSKK